MSSSHGATVAIVGGGLAGLAAGCALSDCGVRVTLFERRPYLGGRASSYHHPATDEVLDNCQHVLFGCCTNLIELYRRIGVLEKIRWSDRMTFIEPGGCTSILRSSSLPAPFLTFPSFVKFPFLSMRDKLAITRAMARLVPYRPRDQGESFLSWLRRHGQTEMSIQRFWRPILVSALSEELDRISVPYAAQVVRETAKSGLAREMGIPTIPLSDLYDAARDYILARGGELRMRCGVEGFHPQPDQVTLAIADSAESFDFVIVAVPFFALSPLLPSDATAEPLREKLAAFQTSPITGIHLWFDRQITDLEHAVLLDRTIQWLFHKSKLLVTRPARDIHAGVEGEPEVGAAGLTSGSYVELVVSASKSLIEQSRAEIIEIALRELREFLPQARDAKLLKAAVVKEVYATYSPLPGIDALRPPTETVWPRVFLAGDWVATGWPATMESAVRGGYLAADAVANNVLHRSTGFFAADLRSTGFMRFFR